jgi:DNA-directed RNA polymerase sigma subunit (sigma70/sigma32)
VLLFFNSFASSPVNIIQDLIKLEKLQKDLAEKCGGQPTFAEWATMAGVDQKTLRKRLNYGVFCKEKMIKSNIRLVISVAKNYQGSGMSLQDLVQVYFHLYNILLERMVTTGSTRHGYNLK